jgi:hypothetical protein
VVERVPGDRGKGVRKSRFQEFLVCAFFTLRVASAHLIPTPPTLQSPPPRSFPPPIPFLPSRRVVCRRDVGADQRARLPKNTDPVPALAFSEVAFPGAAYPRQPFAPPWHREERGVRAPSFLLPHDQPRPGMLHSASLAMAVATRNARPPWLNARTRIPNARPQPAHPCVGGRPPYIFQGFEPLQVLKILSKCCRSSKDDRRASSRSSLESLISNAWPPISWDP